MDSPHLQRPSVPFRHRWPPPWPETPPWIERPSPGCSPDARDPDDTGEAAASALGRPRAPTPQMAVCSVSSFNICVQSRAPGVGGTVSKEGYQGQCLNSTAGQEAVQMLEGPGPHVGAHDPDL